MAGMFYTIQEVAAKLGKNEDQIKQLVQEGKLREFRDGAKVLFKINEVDALAGPSSPAVVEESVISLVPLEDTESMAPGTSGSAAPTAPFDLADEILMPESPNANAAFSKPLDLDETAAPKSVVPLPRCRLILARRPLT